MLSHFRRSTHHHNENDGSTMKTRTNKEQHHDGWKSSDKFSIENETPSLSKDVNMAFSNNSPLLRHHGPGPNTNFPLRFDRVNGSPVSNPFHIDSSYPTRPISASVTPDLSRAIRFDAHLLAIVRIEDKRNAFYSAEVVSKLRQKERTQSFINKPCSLYVTDRALIVFDRATQVIAETIPLDNVDPTCVHADSPDTLNDIFMYRLLDRQLASTSSHASSSTHSDSSPVVVFKCSNNDAKALVDSIRTANGKPLKHLKSEASDSRTTLDRRVVIDGFYSGNVQQRTTMESSKINHSIQQQQQQTRMITQQTTMAATDYYKRLTEELNKCFDDIELFVRYLEAMLEYTKELERDHRRKDKKATGLKQMIEKLPDDRYFIDILQKFKHSFNLLGELKHIIHNPNAPELIHYLLSPLQFILYTLRTKHVHQLQLAQEIWTPALTKEARDLLLNCLTSKEHEILRNLGQAWIRSMDESIPKFSDYRPVFFEGRTVWLQDEPITTTHPFTQFDERPTTWTSTNSNMMNSHNTTYTRQPSPPGASQFDTSTIDRKTKNNVVFDDYNSQMQNEHAWAIDRKRAGAKICAVKIDRKGQNNKELTVRRGELIEIEDWSKKWWRARNYLGEVGHVPNNIVEEIDIEQRPMKLVSSTSNATNRPLSNTNSRSRYN